MVILDGKKLSSEILAGIKKEVLKDAKQMQLDVILVGNSPASEVFVRRKNVACLTAGINFVLHRFSKSASLSELKKTIKKLAATPRVSGIVIQLPLPPELNKQELFDLIPPEKDVDILSANNLGQFYSGNLLYMPPVVGTVSHFFNKYKISSAGKNVVLVGAGRLVGFPLSLWFFRKKATVSVVNEFTKNICAYTIIADIIISGVGSPGFIKGSMVKKGAVIVDVGISFKKGKVSGDFDFKSVAKKAGYITPVPGGVGPMTISCVLENMVALNKNRF